MPERIDSDRLQLWVMESDARPAGDGCVDDDALMLSVLVDWNLEHLRPHLAWATSEPISLAQRRAQIAGWRRSWEAGGDFVVGVYRWGILVGVAGVHGLARARDARTSGAPAGGEVGSADVVVSVGLWLGRAYWGRGYGTEAAGALSSLVLRCRPEVSAVRMVLDAANTRALRVPERLGFEQVATMDLPKATPARTGVGVVWELHRDRWLYSPVADITVGVPSPGDA